MNLEEILAQELANKAALSEIAAAERELEAKRRAIYEVNDELREAKRVLREEARREAERLAQLAREEALRQAQLEHERLLALQGSLLDTRTAQAKWRPRAMQHQLDGAKFLATSKRALCADGVGVGKTLQSLMFLDMVESDRALIICPGDVMTNFVDELKRFTDRPVLVIGKKPKEQALTLIGTLPFLKKAVVIINYESWFRNWAILDSLIAARFDSVIVDEAHSIKETDKKPYQGVEKIVLAENSCPIDHAALKLGKDGYLHCSNSEECDWYSGYRSELLTKKDRRSVKNFLPMSGTPILNRPEEIYPLLHLIDDTIFKTKAAFVRDLCITDYYTGKTGWGPNGEANLAKRISAFYLRRTHETAGIVLPPQGITVHEVDFDAELYPLQAKCIKLLKHHAQLEVSEGRAITIAHKIALITRLRQAATWPGGIRLSETLRGPNGEMIYEADEVTPKKIWHNVGDNYRESQKMDKVVELIQQLNDDGQRVAVFSQFATAMEELQTRLGDRSVRFDGSTAGDVRESVKSNFNREFGEAPKWDNILCNYKTGGVGLNLTACTAVVILDYEWNNPKAEQAYGRINRIGQTENTQVHIFKLMMTMDEWMDDLMAAKQKIIGNFERAMESSDELKNSFAKDLDKLIQMGE